jgi:hypothetical protein
MKLSLIQFASFLFLIISRAAFGGDGPADPKAAAAEADVLGGRFRWTASAPLIAAVPAVDGGCAIKDPSIVFYDGRWHVYATLRNETFAHMEYLSFKDWPAANAAERSVISLVKGYHCAPQIFYFTPQRKWYLIYQCAALNEAGFFGPVYSTLDDVSRPQTLTPPSPLFNEKPKNVVHWLDFWVICDDAHAYLFFTGDDGRFWRSRTALADFPGNWSAPELARHDPHNEFFEATCTYRLKGMNKYLTLAEAIGPNDRRYYKAFLADKLDAEWVPLAGAWARPFASIDNVDFAPGVKPWTDSISHGELLRDGFDEKLVVDPAHLRFLFQGCSAKERAGKKYSQFPWRLGLLTVQ